jgi:hypothetical protein
MVQVALILGFLEFSLIMCDIYNMNYFINVYEKTGGVGGTYNTYQLYSSESLDTLKIMIFDTFKDNWNYVSNIENRIDNMDPSFFDLKTLQIELNSIMSDYIKNSEYDDDDDQDMDSYEIIIGDPYNNIEESMNFYKDYVDEEKELPEGHGAIYFRFDGDYILSISGAFPYILSINTDYGVTVQGKAFDRIALNVM